MAYEVLHLPFLGKSLSIQQ